jgi:hypothetical protein
MDHNLKRQKKSLTDYIQSICSDVGNLLEHPEPDNIRALQARFPALLRQVDGVFAAMDLVVCSTRDEMLGVMADMTITALEDVAHGGD